MDTTTRISRFVRPMLLLVAGAASIALGACKDQDEPETDPIDSVQTKNSCDKYCAQAKLCDENLNEEKCINTCVDAIGSCMADERDIARNQIGECAKEACEDFVGCTIDASVQCYFGL